MPDNNSMPCLHAYPEMYCLFSAGIEIGRSSCDFDRGKALRLICNLMGQVDRSLDTCVDAGLRNQLQSLVVEYLRGAADSAGSSPLKNYCFFNDLSELRSTLPEVNSLQLADLAQTLFCVAESERTETRISRLVRSRARQGRLAAQAVVTAIGVHDPDYIRLMQAFGAAGQIWDSFNDAQRDYLAGEVVIKPSQYVTLQYAVAFAKEFFVLIVVSARHPLLFTRVTIQFVRTTCSLAASWRTPVSNGSTIANRS